MRYIVEWFDNGAGCATIEKEFENLEDARKAFNEMCFDYNQSTETDQQGVEILLGRVDESGDYEQLESYDGEEERAVASMKYIDILKNRKVWLEAQVEEEVYKYFDNFTVTDDLDNFKKEMLAFFGDELKKVTEYAVDGCKTSWYCRTTGLGFDIYVDDDGTVEAAMDIHHINDDGYFLEPIFKSAKITIRKCEEEFGEYLGYGEFLKLLEQHEHKRIDKRIETGLPGIFYDVSIVETEKSGNTNYYYHLKHRGDNYILKSSKRIDARQASYTVSASL